MGSTQIQQPSPPPQPSTGESIDAYIEGMPKMYETQMEWAPQITGQQVGMAQEFLPQVTALQQQLQQQYLPQNVAQQMGLQMEYAPQLAAQQQALQRQYEPEAFAAKEALGGITTPGYLEGEGAYQEAGDPLLEQMRGTATPEWMTGYQMEQAPGFMAAKERVRQDVRGAWAGRGLAESGMSAEDEAMLMSEMEYPYAMQMEQASLGEQARRQQLGAQLGTLGMQGQESALSRYYSELGRRQNVGLSMAGRFNVPTQQQVGMPLTGLPQFQGADVMQGYNFPQVQNAMQQGYGSYAGLYGNMYGANAQGGGARDQMWGQIGGGAIAGVGMAI